MEEIFKGTCLNIEVVLTAEHGRAPFGRSKGRKERGIVFWQMK